MIMRWNRRKLIYFGTICCIVFFFFLNSYKWLPKPKCLLFQNLYLSFLLYNKLSSHIRWEINDLVPSITWKFTQEMQKRENSNKNYFQVFWKEHEGPWSFFVTGICNWDFTSNAKGNRTLFSRENIGSGNNEAFGFRMNREGESVILSCVTFHCLTPMSASIQVIHPSFEVKHIYYIILWIWQDMHTMFWGKFCCFCCFPFFVTIFFFNLLIWAQKSETKSTFDSFSDHPLKPVGRQRWCPYHILLVLILFINSIFFAVYS